jgi:flagellar basal body rod protein FlgC
MSIKVGEIAGSALENNRLKLNVAVSELHASLEATSIFDETEFRAQMKNMGTVSQGTRWLST